jgi:hypothetical protein
MFLYLRFLNALSCVILQEEFLSVRQIIVVVLQCCVKLLYLRFLKVLSCVLFQEEFLTTLNVHELGFYSLEAFLLVLEQSDMLHLRYVKTEILVYPAAQKTEPEQTNLFPHIMEVRACYTK